MSEWQPIETDPTDTEATADANAEIVGKIREAAVEVFGGNCSYADDDLARLKEAALQAVRSRGG